MVDQFFDLFAGDFIGFAWRPLVRFLGEAGFAQQFFLEAAKFEQLLLELLGPTTYLFLADYFAQSAENGVGGHALGMAASSSRSLLMTATCASCTRATICAGGVSG